MSNVWYRRWRSVLRRSLRRAAVAAITPLKKLPWPRDRRPIAGSVPTTKGWIESMGGQVGATYVAVHAPSVLNRELTDVDPAVARHFPVGSYRTPETYVAAIPGAKSLGVDGLVVTPDQRLLMDISDRRGKPLNEYREMQWPCMPRIETLKGTAAVLGVRHCGNYYHWLLDVLPRIELLRLAGVRVDRYVVHITHAFQLDTLRMLGIRDEQIVSPHSRSYIQPEVLLVPSLPGIVGVTSTWVSEFLRTSLRPSVRRAPSTSTGYRRLYISRRGAKLRRIVNEAELLPVLAAHGVETVVSEKLTAAEQIALFSQAELVVSSHGAGLTNILFCDNPAAVVELFGEKNGNPCFWTIAAERDFVYLPRIQPERGDDLVVDPRFLDATLREALARVEKARVEKAFANKSAA